MEYVDFFDISSLYNGSPNGTWHRQKTTGDIPEPRIDFCIVTVSAPDNSSHNIYMYGGAGKDKDTFFDTIHVLTIPSFTWIRIFEGKSPRFAHTCHVVGNRQMITVGGANDTVLNRGCDWETKSVAIYNLATLEWGSVFDANAPPYQLPGQISSIIGGG